MTGLRGWARGCLPGRSLDSYWTRGGWNRCEGSPRSQNRDLRRPPQWPMISITELSGPVQARALMSELPAGVVPVQPRDGAGAVLIGIGCPIVGEQREVGIRSGIDAYLGDRLRLMGVFYRRTHGHD